MSEDRSLEQLQAESEAWLRRFAEREERAAQRAETRWIIVRALACLAVAAWVVTMVWEATR